jgi:hypothetical protein
MCYWSREKVSLHVACTETPMLAACTYAEAAQADTQTRPEEAAGREGYITAASTHHTLGSPADKKQIEVEDKSSRVLLVV